VFFYILAKKLYTMKKLLLLSLTVLLFSCGDNDDSNSDSTQNFLEKYNGVVWKDGGIDDGFGDYFYYYYRFTPNSITEAEKYGSDCEPISTNWDFVDSDGYYLRVVENLPEKLVLEENELDDTETDFEIATYTITTINDGNGIEIRYSIDNYIDIDTYTRVSDFCE